MEQEKAISLVNKLIDKMIITGEDKSNKEKYKELIKKHYQLTK